MDLNEIKNWFDRPRESSLDQGRVMELYATFHPRTAFLKTLPTNSCVVDVGAGDGSLSVFRSWPEPARMDLKLHAYAMEKGRLFDSFDSHELGNWNVAPPEFDGLTFDAIVCAHFIEHVLDPESLVHWAGRKLKPSGRIYLEWPSPASLQLPSRKELSEQGVAITISNFSDDATHNTLPDFDRIAATFLALGFLIESRGIVRLPWLEHEMLAHFKGSEDQFPCQAAFWSFTGWSQYLVASRPN